MWRGNNHGKRCNLVKCDNACKSKQGDNLKLKSLLEWNVVVVLKFLSFYGLTKPCDVSWACRNLFHIKNKIKPYFQWE